MKATIYYHDTLHNDRDDRWNAFNGHYLGTPDKYVKVCELDASDITWGSPDEDMSRPEEVLDALFQKFNIGDRADLRVRSMSVGDIVVLDARAWICKSLGWERMDENPFADDDSEALQL